MPQFAPNPWRSKLIGSVATALYAALVVSGCGGDSVQSLLASGQALSEKRDFKGAIIQYKTALQKDPQSGEARVLLGKALLDASDPVAATAELTRALDLKVDAAKVVPALARSYLLTGEYKKLTTQFGELQLEDKRALASLKSSVATAWAAQGDKAKTESALAAALVAQPDFPPALVLQARMEAGKGQYDRANSLVDEALKADGRLHEAWHLKGEILAHGKGDNAAAIKAFKAALDVEPSYIQSHMALIEERIKAQDLPGAKSQFESLRKVLPKHPQTIYIEAQLAFGAREFKKARDLSQALLRGAPSNSSILQLAGAVEEQLGSLILAETHFAKALQLNPRLLGARRSLSRIYLRLGQPQKALDTLQPLLNPDARDPDALALAGDAYLRLGNAQQAEIAFRQAVSLKPDNTRVRTALALTYIGRGDAQTAFSTLEGIANESRTDTFTDHVIVSARLRRREFDLALKAADLMVAKAPEKAAALELRGRVQTLRKDFVAARKDFEKALQVEASQFSAVVSLAELDLLEKKPEQARKRLEASLKADPKNYFARLALVTLLVKDGQRSDDVKALLSEGIQVSPMEPSIRVQMIEFLVSSRQFKEAIAVAQAAVTAFPGDLRVLDAVGRAQMEAGDVEQSIATFRRLVEADPKSPAAYLRLADIYKATNRPPAAENALRKALEIDPKALAAQEAFANLLLTTNRYPEVLNLARTMQQQRPRGVEGYALEANVYLRQQKFDSALAAYRRGLDVKGHDRDMARRYYLALHLSGRPVDAERFGTEWLRTNPNDLIFDYQMAVIAIQRKEFDQAEGRLQRIVTLQPEYAAAFNNLAWVLASRSKPGGAAFAQRAVDLAPNKPEFMDTLALALMVEKQPAKALELQKKVVELRPTEPAYRLSLARMAIEAGDKALARTELERLKALGASYPQQAEVAALAQKL